MIFKNASSRTLDQDSGTLPNVSIAMKNWFQKITFTTITKTIVNYKVVETEANVTFQGVWQAMSPQAVRMKPEGQRVEKWFTIHSEPSLELKPDDKLSYLGIEYRVMDRMDHNKYGYFEYHAIEDFQ